MTHAVYFVIVAAISMVAAGVLLALDAQHAPHRSRAREGNRGVTDAPSWFQRYLLPGFAFKAVIIGGGYATGRELAEFFLPSGPWGGIAAMLLAMMIWSGVCVATFVFARRVGARDYRSFFESLLGRGWFVFEAAYLLFVVLILAVFGAAAGAIGNAMFGVPMIVGTFALAIGIACFVTFGNASVERLFKYVSFLLYARVRVVHRSCDHAFRRPHRRRISRAMRRRTGWAIGGVTYASYNIIGAVVILPVLRHMTSDRDAVIAGLIAGPLAMIPAMLFFISMIAFYPAIANETLPSDFLLQRFDLPVFHVHFPVHDLLRAARKRHRRRARDQRTHRARVEGARAALRSRATARLGTALVLLVVLHVHRRPLRSRRADRERLSRARLHFPRRLRAAAADARASRVCGVQPYLIQGDIMKRIAVVALRLSMPSPRFAAPPDNFEKRADDVRQAAGVPGMAIAIVEDDKVTFAKGFGVRKLGSPEKRRRRHDFPDRLDRQGVHRRRSRHPDRAGQDELGRQGHRPSARIPDVRSVGHARDDDPRSARASQRPRPRRGRSDVRAAHKPEPRRIGEASALHQTRDEFPQRVRVRQRAVHGHRPAHRSGERRNVGTIHREPSVESRRHAAFDQRRRRALRQSAIAPIRTRA